MKAYRILIFLLLLCPATLPGREFIRFHTGNSDISYDGIKKIYQDSRGFIWIGTFKGLNRYDGTRFRVWCRDEMGLSSDFIRHIAEDGDGNLWIGTDAGVSCYLRDEDRFEPLKMEADNGMRITGKVSFLSCDSDGLIRIMSGFDGCFIYDPHAKTLVNYLRGAGKEAACSFRKLLGDGEGGYWLSKYCRNIYHADSVFSNRHAIDLGEQSSWFAGDDVEGLLYAGGDSSRFYAISSMHGISEVCPAERTVRSRFRLPKDITINDVCLEDGHRFWLSTSTGLWSYDLASGESRLYTKEASNPLSLSDNHVRTACVDRSGGLWVGTKDGGLHYSGRDQLKFGKIYDQALKGAIVSGFATDGRDRVWVTTEHNGLFCYHLSSGILEAVRTGLHNVVLCSPCYLSGSLWIGSQSGLYRYDVNSRKMRFYGHLRNKGVDDGKVYVVTKTGEEDLYVSTTRGLFRYDEQSDSFISLDEFYGYFITSVAEDKDGRLWISTFDDGILLWDTSEGKLLRHYCVEGNDGLASDKVCSIYVDSSGTVWAVGFSSGFYRMDREADRFVRICQGNTPALPSNVFFRAAESGRGDLFLSSDTGLVRYVPETAEVEIYTEMDGLLERKFTNSSLRLPGGEILMGSDNGFIRFNPSSPFRSGCHPVAEITRLRIEDSLVEHFSPSKPLILEARQNNISFEFAILDSSFPATAHLQCRLDNFDEDWREVSAEKQMAWFNLSPGTYYLRMRTAPVGGTWEEKAESLKIVVKPSFWGSPTGVFLILLFSIIALTGFVCLVLWQLGRRQRIEEERFQKAKEEEMFSNKLDFFSYVIHEIKTPLTLIRVPLSRIIAKGKHDPESEHDLSVMQDSADYLTSLVNELLDFVRVERHGYELHKVNVNLIDKLGKLVLNFSDMAALRNIAITFNPPALGGCVSADMAALDKILNNLLSNAVKHAESRIDIEVQGGTDKICVSFSNDGQVIPEDYRELVFRPFVQYHGEAGSISDGVGIGLPLSKRLAQMHGGDLVLADVPGETRFILTLPCSDDEPSDLPPGESGGDVSSGDDRLPLILLVEDNRELAAYIAQILEKNYSVRTAHSADSALSILKEQPVDLVLTDISMPGRSGLELCRDIRADIETSHIPIIVLSSIISTQSKVEAMRLGADLFIEKPFDIEYLQASIQNIVSRRSLMRRTLSRGLISQDIAMFGLPRRDEEFFLKLDKVIMDHLPDGDITNELLAAELAVSQATLVRKVRRLLGTSPNNYVRNKRLAVAESMMRESSDNTVSEICYAVGFTNLSYFAKCFREQYGKTPSEYMESLS